MNDIDIKSLIKWLGAEGAKEGIKKSRKLTVSILKKIANNNEINYGKQIKRNELINLLILKYDKKINKTAEELIKMETSKLSEYLAETNCTKEELVELLKTQNIPFKKTLSKNNLIHYAADELSNIGMFERIAEGKKK